MSRSLIAFGLALFALGCPTPGVTCEDDSQCAGSRCVAGQCVEEPPAIASFTITPPGITVGDSADLVATFRNGTGHVDPLGPVTSGELRKVSPQESTEYRLTVTGPSGETVSQTQTLVVHPAPAVLEFGFDPPMVLAGETSNLIAVFSGGWGTISPDIGEVTSGQVVAVNPTVTTQYTLTVTNPLSVKASATATVAVRVVPDPCGDLFVNETAGLRVCGKTAATAYTTGRPRLVDEAGVHALSGRVPASPLVREPLTGTDPQSGAVYSLH